MASNSYAHRYLCKILIAFNPVHFGYQYTGTLANSAELDEMLLCGISSGSALFAKIKTRFKNNLQGQNTSF